MVRLVFRPYTQLRRAIVLGEETGTSSYKLLYTVVGKRSGLDEMDDGTEQQTAI